MPAPPAQVRWIDAAGRRIDPAALPGDTRAAIRRAVELALSPVRSPVKARRP